MTEPTYMPESNSIHFQLGTHTARLDSVDQRLIEIENSQHKQTDMLNILVNRGERQKGSISALTAAGSAVIAVAALLVDYFKK